MAENGLGVLTPYNGVCDGRDPDGTGENMPALASTASYIFGHSLASRYNSPPDDTTATPWTVMFEWFGYLASRAGRQAGGSHSFGQIDTHNAQPWPEPVSNGSYAGGTFDPWPSGNFADQNFEHFYVMPSNYLEEEMGYAPFSAPVAGTVASLSTLIDNIRASYPNADVVIYCHWPDAGPYNSGNPLTPAIHQTYRGDTKGDWLDWFIELQNTLVASGRPVRMIPVGPIIATILDQPFMANVTWAQLYDDNSPHGREPIYMLAAFICYRAIMRENPDVSNWAYPAGATQQLSEITDNLPAIVDLIQLELHKYNYRTDSSRVIVDEEL